jgi:hypothetical protein
MRRAELERHLVRLGATTFGKKQWANPSHFEWRIRKLLWFRNQDPALKAEHIDS